MGEGSQVT